MKDFYFFDRHVGGIETRFGGHGWMCNYPFSWYRHNYLGRDGHTKHYRLAVVLLFLFYFLSYVGIR